jgi:hypothetical protein
MIPSVRKLACVQSYVKQTAGRLEYGITVQILLWLRSCNAHSLTFKYIFYVKGTVLSVKIVCRTFAEPHRCSDSRPRFVDPWVDYLKTLYQSQTLFTVDRVQKMRWKVESLEGRVLFVTPWVRCQSVARNRLFVEKQKNSDIFIHIVGAVQDQTVGPRGYCDLLLGKY